MHWYYVDKGQQAGPVTEEQLQHLFQAGKIDANTAVWSEGMPDWKPFGQVMTVPGRSPLLQATGAGTRNPGTSAENICAECGQYFPTDELISLNKTLVCAKCKPLFLQRMAEGAALGGAGGIWREGKKLVTRSETPFPDRCVKCNAPANGFRLKRTLYWHHPAIYLLILCNIIIYALVAMIVRKKAVLHIGLCETHRKQRRRAIIMCWFGIVAGIVLMVLGGKMGSGWMTVSGILVLLAGLIWSTLKGRMITTTKIDKDQVWVNGAGREFLDLLPER